jgi:toxin YoeB
LLLSIKESPFAGIGKPEALKYNLSGKWSRRITDADRIIYSVAKNLIQVHSLKGHYL